MPRILSFQQEGQWTPFELTIRAMQGRFLLRPCPAAASLIIGVLARAQELYGDRIHIYYGAGTSNHLHLLIESKSSIDRAHFKAFIMANISKELGHLFKWTEHLFGRRTRDIPILDPDAFMQRIEYFAQHWRKKTCSLCSPQGKVGNHWVLLDGRFRTWSYSPFADLRHLCPNLGQVEIGGVNLPRSVRNHLRSV